MWSPAPPAHVPIPSTASEIATGETKLLVEDTFFIGGDLSPVGDTLYWYDTDYDLTYGRLNQIDLESGGDYADTGHSDSGGRERQPG